MQLSRTQIVVLTGAVLLLIAPPRMGGEDSAPQWPSDQESRLEDLDSQVLETKRKLFAAKQASDSAAVEKLSKEYKEQQKERLELLRATGQLPPH